MSWNRARKSNPPPASGGIWLRVKDGENFAGVPVGTPAMLKKHWCGGRSRLCLRPDHCPYCVGEEEAEPARVAYLGQFWLPSEQSTKILEMSPTVFSLFCDEMAEVEQDGGDPDATLFRLSRNGSGIKTRWSVRARGEMAAPDDVELHDLAEFGGRSLTMSATITITAPEPDDDTPRRRKRQKRDDDDESRWAPRGGRRAAADDDEIPF